MNRELIRCDLITIADQIYETMLVNNIDIESANILSKMYRKLEKAEGDFAKTKNLTKIVALIGNAQESLNTFAAE